MTKRDKPSVRPRAASAPMDRARQILTQGLDKIDYGPMTDPPDPLPLTKQEAVAVQEALEKPARAVTEETKRRRRAR